MRLSGGSTGGEKVPGSAARERCRMDLRGRVQGVGFRPWIHRLAVERGLAGLVGNSPQGAFLEVEGLPESLASFRRALFATAPPLVAIASLAEVELPALGETEFRIAPSSHAGIRSAEISPDVATCPDCLREMRDPADRRHRYPFINCTNCGPRYSIIRALPYDRESTTMAPFAMCPDCRAEYDDPADRRFHAQPNACPRCGPRLWLCDASGAVLAVDAIAAAAEMLEAGRILAIKGLGGFHLACRADLDEAVVALRRRKARETKPLAIMAPDLAAARRLVHLDAAGAEILASPASPILLAPARSNAPVSAAVAPGAVALGVMLPNTPLHTLLFAEGLGPLVMTSGNPSAEPLCRDNGEALLRLSGIADAFLCHDRDIERRVDDSVVLSVGLPAESGGSRAALIPLRRARGYAPEPIRLANAAPLPILALGGELKSSICLYSGSEAFLGEHLGDLDNPAAYRTFLETVGHCQRLLDIEPERVACDMHPDYAATRRARELGLPLTEVQHHHAHIVSCMADNGISGDVIGLACDGTGYGDDGSVWGCELLVCDEACYRRAGHLRSFPLFGGDAAARETWRPAAGLLREAFGDGWRGELPGRFSGTPDVALDMAERFFAAPASPVLLTSSLGRLFDGVAFLLGLCDHNHSEAQAPMALEAAAAAGASPLACGIYLAEDGGRVLDHRPLIRAIVDGVRAGAPVAELAGGFHEALALLLAEAAVDESRATGLTRVVLSGGCFANRLLTERCCHHLKLRGLAAFIHRRVPTGDGGLALGQAVVAAARLAEEARD